MTLQGVGPEGAMGAQPGLPRGSGGVKGRRLGEGVEECQRISANVWREFGVRG